MLAYILDAGLGGRRPADRLMRRDLVEALAHGLDLDFRQRHACAQRFISGCFLDAFDRRREGLQRETSSELGDRGADPRRGRWVRAEESGAALEVSRLALQLDDELLDRREHEVPEVSLG